MVVRVLLGICWGFWVVHPSHLFDLKLCRCGLGPFFKASLWDFLKTVSLSSR